MDFDTRRLSQLAGISDSDSSSEEPHRLTASSSGRSRARRLDETCQGPSDESQLRLIIRREARRMIQERLSHRSGVNLSALQEKKSLSEAITMGFAGLGFGGTSPVLGGPMTSARSIASFDAEEAEGADSSSDLAFDADRWMVLATSRRR